MSESVPYEYYSTVPRVSIVLLANRAPDVLRVSGQCLVSINQLILLSEPRIFMIHFVTGMSFLNLDYTDLLNIKCYLVRQTLRITSQLGKARLFLSTDPHMPPDVWLQEPLLRRISERFSNLLDQMNLNL